MEPEGEIKFEHIMICLFGGVGIPLFLSALVQLKRFDRGAFYVLLPVICAFTTDIGAYFAGVFLGKHRGITQVSPNKSLEGYIGGILSGCLFMLLYGLLVEYFGGIRGPPACDGPLWPAGERRHRAGGTCPSPWSNGSAA